MFSPTLHTLDYALNFVHRQRRPRLDGFKTEASREGFNAEALQYHCDPLEAMV